MSSYTYLALGISNPIGAKLSRWRLRTNSFGATRIYVEVIRNVTIVTLAQNYPARTLELFPLGAKLVLRTDSTLRRNFSAGV